MLRTVCILGDSLFACRSRFTDIESLPYYAL